MGSTRGPLVAKEQEFLKKASDIPIYLSTSEASDDPSSSDTEASSGHSDRSDSEVDYEAECDDEEEDEEDNLVPRPKKQKTTMSERKIFEMMFEDMPLRKKSRVKFTAKRKDCYTPKQRATNPGRRVVGKRIYDSFLGKTCHWCRQKTVELHVECTLCPIRFCGPCLWNRNGEKIIPEMQTKRWVCPKCRGGCGPACKNCCNCGPCRKSQHLSPTGQVVNTARLASFTNAHDYLIHLKTKEDPQTISKRKEGRKWSVTGHLDSQSAGVTDDDVEEEDAVKEEDDSDLSFDLRKGDIESDMDLDGKKGGDIESEAEQSEPDRDLEEDVDILSLWVVEDLEKKEGDIELAEEQAKHETVKEVKADVNKAPQSEMLAVKMEPQDPKTSEVEDKATFQRARNFRDEKIAAAREKRYRLRRDKAVLMYRGVSKSLVNKIALEDSADWSMAGIQGSDFAGKLEQFQKRPFSMPQLKEMLEHISFRKPVMKTRQTRRRSIEVPCSEEGFSYLDHYPDFENKLQNAKCPEEKLKLLRGFFFWLQHSCMEEAFRPWASVENAPDDTGECVEINGPDCQIIRVLLSIDENEDTNNFFGSEWEDKKPKVDTRVEEEIRFSNIVFAGKVKEEPQD